MCSLLLCVMARIQINEWNNDASRPYDQQKPKNKLPDGKTAVNHFLNSQYKTDAPKDCPDGGDAQHQAQGNGGEIGETVFHSLDFLMRDPINFMVISVQVEPFPIWDFF